MTVINRHYLYQTSVTDIEESTGVFLTSVSDNPSQKLGTDICYRYMEMFALSGPIPPVPQHCDRYPLQISVTDNWLSSGRNSPTSLESFTNAIRQWVRISVLLICNKYL